MDRPVGDNKTKTTLGTDLEATKTADRPYTNHIGVCHTLQYGHTRIWSIHDNWLCVNGTTVLCLPENNGESNSQSAGFPRPTSDVLKKMKF